MRILYITYFFYPEIGAASIRASDFVKILVEMGYEVDILTSLPHYPSGKLYSDFKDHYHGAKVITIKSALSSNSDSSKKRLLAQFDFFLKAKNFNAKDYDLIISSTPPLFVSWLGTKLAKKYNILHVVDLRDLWPESVVETKMMSPHNPLAIYAKHISNYVVKNADIIISPFKGILKRYTFKRTLWIPNSLTPLQEPLKTNNKKLRAIYAGTIGHMQYVELLNDVKSENFEIVVVGFGKNVKKLTNVNYLGPMSRENTIREINRSDIGFVLLKNTNFFKDALPSKIFEYIAYGKPVISNLLGETAKFLKNNRCGITVDSSKKAIIAALEFLAKNPNHYEYLSKNALKTSKKYSKRENLSKLFDLIDTIHKDRR